MDIGSYTRTYATHLWPNKINYPSPRIHQLPMANEGYHLNNLYSIHIGFYILTVLQFLQSFHSLFYNTICTLTWLELPSDGIVMEVKTVPKWKKLDNWRQKTILTNPNPFITSLESPVEFYGFLLLRSTFIRVIFLTLRLMWRYFMMLPWEMSHPNITPRWYYGLNLKYL